ncbi:AEC family transporter [Acuticoccus sp. I52.16.1]|uniref:AEC family transporter n=1 Tax=Acuticoccus sp. I52.16.1 TaxID=2928472 RepID=UPI001FD4B32A|nr:AEC family transporter [Acuticoccus sp. I52.16.1]UOM34960.1 AEC family transporter [Acuticoccus sp. I52.16.1]
MAIFEVLGDPVLPVYAIIFVGYLLGRRGTVSAEEARTLNRIALSLFLPLLLFGLIIEAPIRTFDPSPVVLYFAIEVIVFTLGLVLALKVFRLGPGESVLLAFGSIFSNTVLIVLPIAILLYGTGDILPITAIVTLDSTITFALAIIALQIMKLGRVTPLAVLSRVARSPILIAIAAGLVVNLARLPMPHPFVTFIEFNGAAAPPLALLSLGVFLAQTKMTFEAPVLTFSAIKVVIFPLAVWLAVKGFAPGSIGADRFVLGAAAPAGTMAFSLGILYDVKTDRVTQVIIYTNILTMFSLALLA